MDSVALSCGSRTLDGPFRTKKSPSVPASIPFHLKKTGSGLRRQLTTQTVFPCTNLCPGIDAGTGPIAETVSDDLGEMPHERVVIVELVVLDADDRPIARSTDQEIATLGVQERRDSLEHCVRDDLLVLATFPDARAPGENRPRKEARVGASRGDLAPLFER